MLASLRVRDPLRVLAKCFLMVEGLSVKLVEDKGYFTYQKMVLAVALLEQEAAKTSNQAVYYTAGVLGRNLKHDLSHCLCTLGGTTLTGHSAVSFQTFQSGPAATLRINSTRQLVLKQYHARQIYPT